MDGRTPGERSIILELLKTHSIKTVSQIINRDVGEIRRIIGMDRIIHSAILIFQKPIHKVNASNGIVPSVGDYILD